MSAKTAISRTSAPVRLAQAPVVVGRIGIFNLSHGKCWLQHREGEGMEIDEAELAKVLERFFWRRF